MSFREMAAQLDGDDFASRLSRMSALAAAAKFEPQPPPPFIRVDFTNGLPDAYALGRTIEQVHSATAQAAKWIRARSDTPVTRADRERVELVPRAAGRSIFFDFPDTTATTEMLFPGRTETLAEIAAFTLIELLPQTPDDDVTLDALLTEPPAIKRAIDRLAFAAAASAGISFEISTRDLRGEHAVISADQARVLAENLNLPTTVTRSRSYDGTLDGMRTKRRLFYLISDAGDEISGGIADELVPTLREYLGEQVRATIETTTITTPKGSTRTLNRLLDVTRTPMLP